jgi:predicted flap endonuclease-1-like 5' DNA nuclease
MRYATRTFAFALSLLAASSVAQASHYAITEVPRLITSADAEKLKKAGITTTEELFDKAAKSTDRKALAKASGIKAPALMALAMRADLLRVKGVGTEMVLLLEAAGVKSTAELAKKDAAALTTAVTTANGSKKITEKLPSQVQLEDWIDQAKKLPQVLEPK